MVSFYTQFPVFLGSEKKEQANPVVDSSFQIPINASAAFENAGPPFPVFIDDRLFLYGHRHCFRFRFGRRGYHHQHRRQRAKHESNRHGHFLPPHSLPQPRPGRSNAQDGAQGRRRSRDDVHAGAAAGSGKRPGTAPGRAARTPRDGAQGRRPGCNIGSRRRCGRRAVQEAVHAGAAAGSGKRPGRRPAGSLERPGTARPGTARPGCD